MPNYSYITLLTNDSFIYGLIAMLHSYKLSDSKYPMSVICLPEVSAECRRVITDYFGCNIIDEQQLIPADANKEYAYLDRNGPHCYHACMVKLRIFSYTYFDKLVYVDADMIFTRSIDELFDRPSMSAVIDWAFAKTTRLFNAGLMVVEPDKAVYERLIATMNSFDLSRHALDDQQVLYKVFSDWPQRNDLHLPDKYNFMVIAYSVLDPNCLFGMADKSILHMTGREKPWRQQDLNYYAAEVGLNFETFMANYASMINYVLKCLHSAGFLKDVHEICLSIKF